MNALCCLVSAAALVTGAASSAQIVDLAQETQIVDLAQTQTVWDGSEPFPNMVTVAGAGTNAANGDYFLIDNMDNLQRSYGLATDRIGATWQKDTTEINKGSGNWQVRT